MSPIDYYRLFHNINNKLDAALRECTIHINLSNIKLKRDLDYYLEHILPDVITNLCSITISNDFLFDKDSIDAGLRHPLLTIGVIKKVQARANLLESKNLQKLTLKNINATQMKLISDKIVRIPQIKCLSISFYGTTAEVLSSIFNNDVIHSKLAVLELTISDANTIFTSDSFIHQFPNLEYLTLTSCRVGNLTVFLSLVQNIKYLRIKIWDFPNQTQIFAKEKLKLPNLNRLILNTDEIEWSFVEQLLIQCGQQLKHLTLIANGGLNFIDGENWKKLIITHLKQLAKFKFDITLWNTSIDNINVSSFNTDFWHQLNVYIACDWIRCEGEDGDIVK
ncbi:unnamed protein product, partial [Rotaria sp. Silwood1]